MLREERVEFEAAWAEEDIATANDGTKSKRKPGGARGRERGDNHRERGDKHCEPGDNHRERGDKHREPGDKHREREVEHREVDRELRRIAKLRAGLDVEEAKWLREAERLQIWRTLGFSTALEYLEDVFGLSPKLALERLRVAKELAQLPELEQELRAGALPYSAARELTRVMTPETERAWLARARGKNLRDIELLVAGHKKGELPDDPKDPALDARDLTLHRLLPAARALWRQMRQVLEDDCGHALDDSQLVETAARRIIDGFAATSTRPGKAPKPAHRISIRKCDDCQRAWQLGAGRWFEIGASDLACAECDAQLVGNENSDKHKRVTQTIPPKTRDRIYVRDGGKCRFPGCRAARNIETHHVVFRAHGGAHDDRNLCLLCSGHHQLLHDGIVTVTGDANTELIFTRDGERLVDARGPHEVAVGRELLEQTTRSRFEDVALRTHAVQAMKRLGYPVRVARDSVDHVLRDARSKLDVQTLVAAAMRALRPCSADELAATTADTVGEHELLALARQALVQAGFKAHIADAAVTAAYPHVGRNGDLATLLKEALRRCAAS